MDSRLRLYEETTIFTFVASEVHILPCSISMLRVRVWLMRSRYGLERFPSTDEGTSWPRQCIEIRAARCGDTLFSRVRTRGISPPRLYFEMKSPREVAYVRRPTECSNPITRQQVLFLSHSSPPPPHPRLVVETLSSLLPTGVNPLPSSPIRSPKPSSDGRWGGGGSGGTAQEAAERVRLAAVGVDFRGP